MRKATGWVLLVLGAFLLTAGVLARFYAAGALDITPLTITSNTSLVGTAEKLNPALGETELLDVKVLSVTKTDDKKSDDDVVAFVNTTCVVRDEPGTPDCVEAGTDEDPDERLISVTTDVFATDRETALSIPEDEMSDYLPDDAVPHEGLVNKWPFKSEKKDYPYWDGMLGKAVTAEYTGTETLEGMEVYVYSIRVDEEPTEVTSGIDGLYSAEKTIKVDPVTGAVVYQKNRDVRTLPDGSPLLDLEVEFTDQEVKDTVAQAEDGGDQLRLVSVTGPIIAVVLGLLLIAGGLFLVLRGRPAEGQRA